MQQQNLFGPANAYGETVPVPVFAPASARNDPPTSREAENRVSRSGRRGRNVGIVLAILCRCPSSTYVELWEAAAEWERAALGSAPEIMRRLNDLKHRGQARQAEARKCRIRGTKMITWIPAGPRGGGGEPTKGPAAA